MTNEICVSLTLEEGKVRKVNYVKNEKIVAISTDGEAVKLTDSKFNEIYEGISTKDIMIDLNELARKEGFAGIDPDSIPRIMVDKKSIEISFLATNEAFVNVIG